MYAIVNIAGQQYKVEKDQRIFVHRLEGKEGDSMNFDEVLLIDNDKSVIVGQPNVKGARIVGKVLSHPKGDKIQVFKKKRRKGYKVMKGHRQYMTEIQIQKIIEKEAAQATASKTTAAKDEKPAAPKKKVPAKKTTAAAKTTGTKKPVKAEKTATAAKTLPTKKTAKTPGKTASAAVKTAGKKPAGKKPGTSTSGTGKKK